MQCTNNLMHIGLALHNYQDYHGSFPLVHRGEKDVQPDRSWRVAVLPFLEAKEIYDQYDFDGPWNSDTNRKLSVKRPSTLGCPSFDHHVTHDELSLRVDRVTNYAAIFGPETYWAALEAQRDGETTFATSSFVAMEIGPPRIPWMAPRDVHQTEVYSRLNPGENFVSHGDGANFLAADASVRFVKQSTSRRELEAQIRIVRDR